MRREVNQVRDRARFLRGRGGGLIVLLPHRHEHKGKDNRQNRADGRDDWTGNVVMRKLAALRNDPARGQQTSAREHRCGDEDGYEKEPGGHRIYPGHAVAFAREGVPPRPARNARLVAAVCRTGYGVARTGGLAAVRGYDVMVACDLPKVDAWVRFPLPAPWTRRRRSQVVRQGSAKAPFGSSNLPVASTIFRMMRIAIVGAGAIGGFLAAALARSGLPLRSSLAAHTSRRSGDGLRVESDLGSFYVTLEAADDLRELGDFDALLLTFKAHQWPQLLPQLGRLRRSGATDRNLAKRRPVLVRAPAAVTQRRSRAERSGSLRRRPRRRRRRARFGSHRRSRCHRSERRAALRLWRSVAAGRRPRWTPSSPRCAAAGLAAEMDPNIRDRRCG